MERVRIHTVIEGREVILNWIEQLPDGSLRCGVTYDEKGPTSYDRSSGDRCYSVWIFTHDLKPIGCDLYQEV